MHKPVAIELFAGLHGWGEGLTAAGFKVIGFDIVDMCSALGHKRPLGVELVLQDVRTLHGSQFRNASLIVASPPCFVSETLILTTRGLLPISEVIVGDLAFTHRNRWRRVLRTGSTIAPTVIASGYGAVLEGTAEHPIYARRDSGSRQRWVIGQQWPVYLPKRLEEPEWLPLSETAEAHWASPVTFDPLAVPQLPNGLPDTPAFWWMVGRWVGDGWLRRRRDTRCGDEVLICCNHTEADELEVHLAAVAPRNGSRAMLGELHWHRSSERTTARFTAASNSLAEWLSVNFGRGAAMKSFPAWALGMEKDHRQALLDGYVSADGNPDLNGNTPIIKTTTVSKRLAISTRFLAASLGCASTTRRQPRPPTCEIEGRTVNQLESWDTWWIPGSGSNRFVERHAGMQWGVVRSIVVGQQAAQVWNLEIEEDNSYVADGVVVHNCQGYSYRAMPWKRAKALPPPDNDLFDSCFRIQREACEAASRYIPMVVENVRGAQKWVGRARWHYGSYYLWGDVPALMPKTMSASVRRTNPGNGSRLHCGDEGVTQHSDGLKFGGGWWHDSTNNLIRKVSSKSPARKAASAMIAKIPFPLARHIAEVYKPYPHE